MYLTFSSGGTALKKSSTSTGLRVQSKACLALPDNGCTEGTESHGAVNYNDGLIGKSIWMYVLVSYFRLSLWIFVISTGLWAWADLKGFEGIVRCLWLL
jgi:hypothetical protein